MKRKQTQSEQREPDAKIQKIVHRDGKLLDVENHIAPFIGVFGSIGECTVCGSLFCEFQTLATMLAMVRLLTASINNYNGIEIEKILDVWVDHVMSLHEKCNFKQEVLHPVNFIYHILIENENKCIIREGYVFAVLLRVLYHKNPNVLESRHFMLEQMIQLSGDSTVDGICGLLWQLLNGSNTYSTEEHKYSLLVIKAILDSFEQLSFRKREFSWFLEKCKGITYKNEDLASILLARGLSVTTKHHLRTRQMLDCVDSVFVDITICVHNDCLS